MREKAKGEPEKTGLRKQTKTPASGCCHSNSSSMHIIFFLTFATALLNFLMAAPNFECAVVAQVLMGTVYVFGIQTVNENLSVLTRETVPYTAS